MKGFFKNMSIRKRISALVVGLAATFALTGCGTPQKDIAINVTILDDSEFWPGCKAELYLKVFDKSKPENFLLCPLNVGGLDSGSKTRMFRTPFVFDSKHHTILRFELLDDDSMSEEQEKLLVDATKQLCQIIHTTAGVYAVPNPMSGAMLIKSSEPVENLLKTGIRALKINLDEIKFEHMGQKDYILFHPSHPDLPVNNSFAIIDGKKARCEVEVLFIPRENNEESKK